MNKLWFEQSLSDAVDKPRLHTKLSPDQDVSYEKIPFDRRGKYRLSREILEGLEKRGHKVTGSQLFAVVQAVFREQHGPFFSTWTRTFPTLFKIKVLRFIDKRDAHYLRHFLIAEQNSNRSLRH